VVDAVHSAAGFGSAKAGVSALAADSMLRSLTERMSSAVGTVVGTGTYQTLGSIGVSLDMTGHMSVDSDKLSAALAKDPSAISNVIAGPTNGTGAADVLRDLVKTFDSLGTGLIATKQTALTASTNDLNARILREQDRLNAYADSLRKQFTALDTSSAATTRDANFLTNFFK
jgi:flagellar hook-associated protein 2